MDHEEFEWFQIQLAKRLRIKKYKKFPAALLRSLLSDPERRYDLEMARRREEEWEGVLPFARAVYRAWEMGGARVLSPRGAQVPERTPWQIGAYEEERSTVFSECLARLAASNPTVERFRAMYLDDRLLSPQQARALLISPVAAHWPYFWFKKFGVSLVDHKYRVTDSVSDEKGLYSLVEVFAPKAEDVQSVPPVKDRRKLESGPWAPPEKPADARSNAELRREFKRWRVLPFPGEDGRPHRVLARPGSVLGDLHEAIGRLIQSCPWEEADAVWFVLTGKPPWVAPFTWQARWFGDHEDEDTFSYGFVTLKIEPWVPAETVEQVYRDIQRGLRGEHRARRLDNKSLKLLQFVNEQVGTTYLSPKERRHLAPELLAAWDEKNPDDTYGSNTWRFWRDYKRVRQAVMSPAYEWRGED